MTIAVMTNADPRFYAIMGPFLSRRPVAKELGSPVWDDDGKVWYVALDDAGRVIGFSAAVKKATFVSFCSDYVVPQRRGGGVYRALTEARLDDFPRGITAIATPMSVGTFRKLGFAEEGRRGSFFVMRKE